MGILKISSANRLMTACKTLALFVPLVACACPRLPPPADNGETLALPNQPIKDPAAWMQQAADQECPGNERRRYAASNDRQFGKVRLVYNPCRSGTNLIYAVFENYADRAEERKFCAIGEVGGSGVSQLPSAPNGYVRVETYWHGSGYEGTVTRYELRPRGVIQIGKARRLVQKLD